MKITEIKLTVLEHPQQSRGAHQLVQVAGLDRIQYTY